MQKEQQIVIDSVAGMNSHDSPFNLSTKEMAYIENCNITKDNKFVLRQGTKVVNGFLDDVIELSLIPSPTPDKILCVVSHQTNTANDGLYSIDYNIDLQDYVLNQIGNISTLPRYSLGVAYGGKTFFSKGFLGEAYETDGNSVSEFTIGGERIGILWETYNERLWNARRSHYDPKLYFSNIGDPYAWESTNFLVLDAEPVAIKAVGEALFVGTSISLWKITATGDSTIPFRLEKISDTGILGGCIAELSAGIACAATVDGRFIIFDNYVKSGAQLQDIGTPVKDIILSAYKGDFDIDDVTKNSLSVSNDGTRLYLSIEKQEFTTTPERKVLVYNVLSGGWTVYTNISIRTHLNHSKGEFFTQLSPPKVYYFADDYYYDDEVFVRWESGNAITEQRPIPAQIITPIYGGESSEIVKNWRNLYMTTCPKTPMEANVYVASNLSQTYSGMSSGSGSDIVGSAVVGQFILGGSWMQNQKIRLDRSSPSLQLKIEKVSDGDFAIDDIKLNYYVGYRR